MILIQRGVFSLIGDQAIRFREQADEEVQFLDLGAAWKERVGLPFVYALWLIRRDYPGEKEVAIALRSLAKRNLENLDELIAKQPQSRQAFCEFYFRQCLHFVLGRKKNRVSKNLLNYASSKGCSRSCRSLHG